MLQMESTACLSERNNQFKNKFGISTRLTELVWALLCKDGLIRRNKGVEEKHLLWALLFLSTYPKEDERRKNLKASRNTFMKWVWIIISDIASLQSKIVSNTKYL